MYNLCDFEFESLCKDIYGKKTTNKIKNVWKG